MSVDRITTLWATAKALQQFHGDDHDESSHGRRKYKSSDVSVRSVSKPGNKWVPKPRGSKVFFEIKDDDGKLIGSLDIDLPPEEDPYTDNPHKDFVRKIAFVGFIKSHEEHRRQGIADALMDKAYEYLTDERGWHIIHNNLSGEGLPWLRRYFETRPHRGKQSDEAVEVRKKRVTLNAVSPLEFHGTTHNEKDHGRRGPDSPLSQYLAKVRNRPGMGVAGIYKVRVEHTDRSRGPAPGENERGGAYNTIETEVEVDALNEDDAKEQAYTIVQSRIGEGMVLEQRVHSVKPHRATRENSSVVANDRSKIVKRTTTPAPGHDNPAAVRASRGQSGKEPERRIPHLGETVDIYRDLSVDASGGRAKKRGFPDHAAFSVRNASGADGNSGANVNAATVGILLDSPRPAWANAEKRKAEMTGKRGVHAFIRGEVNEYMDPEAAKALISQPGWQQVTYFPGSEDFFHPETRQRFLGGEKAVGVDGKFFVLNPQFHGATTPTTLIEQKRRRAMRASGASSDRLVHLWATTKALQEFHGDEHNEKSHGRRGAAKSPAKKPKVLDVPSSKFGMKYSAKNAARPDVKAAKAWKGWDDLPTTDFKPGAQPVLANEEHLQSAPVNRVVSGEVPLREGYDPHILIDMDGNAHVIDGHHRVAMYMGLKRDVMPSKVWDMRKRGIPGKRSPKRRSTAGTRTAKITTRSPVPIGEKQESKSTISAVQEAMVQAATRKNLAAVRHAEETATPDLQEIAGSYPGGHLIGLDYKFKSEESLARKIRDKSLLKAIAPADVKITDSLRYTMAFDHDNFADSVESSIADLEKKGYKMVEIENFWAPGDAYNGINTLFEHPDGTVFELQFHTDVSFRVKDKEIHTYYEEFRKADTTPKRKKELFDIMRQISDAQPSPPGVERICCLTLRGLG